MRQRLILLLTLAVLGVTLACQSTPAPPTEAPLPTATGGDYVRFIEGDLSVELPAWPAGEPSEEAVLITVNEGPAVTWVKVWPFTPRMVVDAVRQWTEEDKATLIDEKTQPDQAQLDLTMVEHGTTLRLRSKLLYCNAHTYEITGAAPATEFDKWLDTFNHVLASAVCSPPKHSPRYETGALGMVIIPPVVDGNEFDPEAYQQSLRLARNSSVQVSHYYFDWGDIETAPGVYDWSVPDYIIEANSLEGLEMSIVLKIIHTTVRGRLPEDIADLPFDDPHFVERLSAFATAFADRYAGRVHYLWIGNEVNDYFVSHRDEIDAYTTAFDQTRSAIKVDHPDLPVGMVFAYHDAETLDALDIVETLNRGDAIAYTIYLYNEGFRFTRDPAEISDYLDRMLELAGDTPVAITETGWTTAPEIEGSGEAQAEFVHQVFAAMAKRRDRIQFLTWFILHDPSRQSCDDQAWSFFPPGTKIDKDEMETFTIFLCYLGLRHTDGTSKLGWEAWVEEAEKW